VISYAVVPSLPAGLSLNTSTGVISGTPTAVTTTAIYNITGTNTGGTSTVSLTITVNDVPPSGLTYSANPATYTRNVAITNNTPSSVGSPVVTYSVSPSLPVGLSLNTATGVISGTPTAITATASYLITATNTGGSTTVPLVITVNDVALGNLSYGNNPAIYTRNTAITNNVPSNTGGVVVSYAVSPTLPAGLSLNTATGVISGTPTAVAATASFTVTATNTGGSTTVALVITVTDIAPSGLSYSANPATYTKGTAIANNMPSSGGGAVVSYLVSPTLPTGLSLNPTTGVISGTPSVAAVTTSYTITATNTGGSTTASLSLTVLDVAPTGLAYLTNPAVYSKDVAISNNTPSNGGGAVVSYAAAPPLPAGLSLNPATGVISGTPTAITATASYIITATNTGGSTTASVSITVQEVAPSGLSYSANPAVYTKNAAIPNNSPSSGGSAAVAYSVAPALPAGLSLNTVTGVISGTPTAISTLASYTVTATNASGSTTASVAITVNDAAPTGLSYSSNPATYTKNTAISSNTPASGGGTVVSYSVAPALPAGLSLNTSTGVITGTPTVIKIKANYSVTATNSGGSTTVLLAIAVNDIAPSGLTYGTNPATYTKSTAIPGNSPSSSGGAVVSYSIAPGLPAGLSLNTVTGVITGTPTSTSAAANFTVTATNTGGSTTVSLSIAVIDVAPMGLTFSPNPAAYTLNAAISTNAPTSSGGAVLSYAVSPALPAGLSLDAITGVLSGTPTTLSPPTDYMVTATNANGSTSVALNITVVDGLTFDLPNIMNPVVTVPLTLNQIPGGTFVMGQTGVAEPIHTVTLSSFYMAKFETTQAQWLFLLGGNPSHFTGDLSRPVEVVSWDDISQTSGFLDKLNAATAATRPAGLVFRLPTEAEWEYACRGGTTTSFYWGDDPALTGSYAWYSANSITATHPVGLKTPNAFGLSDMSGNVWEWCQDYFDTYGSAPQTDPRGPVSGSTRVQRGGSWYNYDYDGRSAVRYPSDPSYRYPFVGFRVVLAAP
jgi:uncharacterized repeat protein (TIGR01451 family)